MMYFGHEHHAAYYMQTAMANSAIYLMTGPVPTEVPAGLNRLNQTPWDSPECVGCIPATTSNPESGVLRFTELISGNIFKTKGWHQHANGEYYYMAEVADITSTIDSPVSIYHHPSYGIQCAGTHAINKANSYTPTIYFTYDSPQTFNRFACSYYYWGKLEYWDGSAWVEAATIGNTVTITDFPEATSDKWRYVSDYYARWYVHFGILGNTNAQVNTDNTVHEVTYALIVQTNAPDVNPWSDTREEDICAMIIEVGQPGEQKPLILDNKFIKKGDSPVLMSCDLVISRMGDDSI